MYIYFILHQVQQTRNIKKRKNTQNVHNDYDKLQRNTACTLKLLKPITLTAKRSEKLDTFHYQFKLNSLFNGTDHLESLQYCICGTL